MSVIPISHHPVVNHSLPYPCVTAGRRCAATSRYQLSYYLQVLGLPLDKSVQRTGELLRTCRIPSLTFLTRPLEELTPRLWVVPGTDCP